VATFTRTGTALERDSGGGSYTSVIANTQRDLHYVLNGGVWRPMLRLDHSNTNVLLNSGAPATQTVANMAAGNYVLWMEGAGTTTLSGGPTGVASAGTPIPFTLGGITSVTFTVAGANATSRFQCETGFTPSSYIATVGAAVTRNQERWNTTMSSSVIQTMTFYASLYEPQNLGFGNMGVMHVGLSTTATPFWRVETGTVPNQLRCRYYDGTTQFNSPNMGVTYSYTDHLEVLSWLDTASGRVKLQTCRNGVVDAAVQTGVISFGANFAGTSLHLGSQDEGAGMGMAAESMAMVTGVQDFATMRGLATPLAGDPGTLPSIVRKGRRHSIGTHIHQL
jgi:hypothetical protein